MKISKAELETFLHGDEVYLTEWESIQEYGTSTLNFSAFFFGVLWLLYRKMYLPALLLFINLVIIDVVVEVVFIRMLHTSLLIAKLFSFILYIILFVLLGKRANQLYLQDAERKISALKELNLPEEEYYSQLRKAGGKYWLILVLIIIGLAGIFILRNLGEVKATRSLNGPIGIESIRLY